MDVKNKKNKRKKDLQFYWLSPWQGADKETSDLIGGKIKAKITQNETRIVFE